MLTRKQHELLMFIQDRLSQGGISPSFDEMKDALGLKSKSGIHRLITGLEERGFIRRLPHRARALEVTRMPDRSGITGSNAGVTGAAAGSGGASGGSGAGSAAAPPSGGERGDRGERPPGSEASVHQLRTGGNFGAQTPAAFAAATAAGATGAGTAGTGAAGAGATESGAGSNISRGRFHPNVIRGDFAGLVGREVSGTAAAVELPLYGRIAAGTPIEALRDHSVTFDVPASLLTPGAEHYALEVAGDSMIEAGIFDGDTVILRRADSAESGDIVVALVDSLEVTLKRLRRKGHTVALEPANPSYETRIFGADRVKVQGKLVGLIRRYR